MSSLLWPLAPSWAQTLPTPPVQLPSAAEPGREPLRPPEPKAQPAAGLAVPQAAPNRAPQGAEQLRFTLRELEISGASAYPAESLRPLYAELLGREITVARAFEVASALELRYRSAGYVTSRVIVPQQTITDGVFKIQVIEGYISEIQYPDEIGPALAAVQRLLAPLRGVKPVSVAEIERRLLLANELPGLTVRSTLEPAPNEPGGSVLVVNTALQPFSGHASLDNRVSPYMGQGELAVGLAFNGLGERADRLSLHLSSSLPLGRSSSATAGWDALLSDEGLNLGLSANLGESHPGLELKPLNVRSKVGSGQGSLTYPLIRSRLENLRLVGQLEAREVSTDLAGQRFTHDQLRIARLGLSYDLTDDWDGINAARITLHQGLNLAGATQRGNAAASRANGRSDFTKLSAELTRVQQLGARSSLLATMAAQWTEQAMLASEEMALGGASFGRAYNDGELSADRGVAAALELRYSPQVSELPLGVQAYGFVDGGRLSATKHGAPLNHARSLASAGLGVRANLLPELLATLEVAQPLHPEVRTEGNKHPRVFFSIAAQF